MTSNDRPTTAGPPDAGMWPAGFSVAQAARAERVLDYLGAIARARRLPLAGRAEVGRLIEAHPHGEQVSEAAGFVHYWVLGPGAGKPLHDLVRAYGEWLTGEAETTGSDAEGLRGRCG